MRLFFWIILCSVAAGSAAQPARPAAHSALDSIAIPATLEDAFLELDRLLDSSHRRQIRDLSEAEMSGSMHFGLGLWMRNNWGLWGGSALQRHLASLGLQHPDDMSRLILTTYRRRLRGEPLGVAEEVERYARYWRVHAEPEKLSFPGCRAGVELQGGIGPPQPDGDPERFIHLGTCRRGGDWWAYEVDRGWYRPNKSIVDQFTGGGSPK